MPDIMKMGKNPNYLGSWDLDDLPNREVTLTISRIVDEEVVTNGKTEVCTACYWQEAAYKPMILNVTNKKTLCKLYKTKATEKLAGRVFLCAFLYSESQKLITLSISIFLPPN